MPVERMLPWHPGLADQAIPFIVAASHAHALPSIPFWLLVPTALVASPALLCPSSLSLVLARVPPGVAPAFCVFVLLLLLIWWRSRVPLPRHGGATTTGPDATHPPTIYQNLGGGQFRGGPARGWGGGCSYRGSGGVFLHGVGGGQGGVQPRARGGGVRVRVKVTELVEPLLVV